MSLLSNVWISCAVFPDVWIWLAVSAVWIKTVSPQRLHIWMSAFYCCVFKKLTKLSFGVSHDWGLSLWRCKWKYIWEEQGEKKADLLYLSCVRYKNGQAVLQDDMMQSWNHLPQISRKWGLLKDFHREIQHCSRHYPCLLQSKQTHSVSFLYIFIAVPIITTPCLFAQTFAGVSFHSANVIFSPPSPFTWCPVRTSFILSACALSILE